MNFKSKLKSIIAAVSAASILALHCAALAAPLSYNVYYEIKERALSEYLTASPVVVAQKDEPTIIRLAKETKAPLGSVTYADVTETEEIAFNTVKRSNPELEKGKTVTVREGVPGVKVNTYNVKYINGVESERNLTESVVQAEAVDKIVEYGSMEEAPETVTAGGLSYKAVYECEATAYDMSPEENGGYGGMTATGVPLDVGIIAVDPKLIPLGSRVYIEALDGSWSYGYALAADTGGAIKGRRVDLCYRTRSECIQFGRRKCRVYVLS